MLFNDGFPLRSAQLDFEERLQDNVYTTNLNSYAAAAFLPSHEAVSHRDGHFFKGSV
jgi:hypothetical protein